MDEAEMRLPKPGESVHIRWPHGLYDFDMEFECVDETMPGPAPGWLWLRGVVANPDGIPRMCTLYVKPTAEGYEMLPMGGGPMD